MDAQALGRYLRQSREARELTLEDAERALHIRRRVLESFELGDFNVPDASIVQIRGFIRNYARFLSLDEERIVQYYEAARLSTERDRTPRGSRKRRKRETQQVMPVAARSITDTDPVLPAVSPILIDERRRQRGADFLTIIFRLLVGGAALAVIAFVFIELTRQPQQARDELVAPDILGQLPASPTFTPEPTATTASLLPTAPPDGADFGGEGVLVTLVTTQRTWLRLEADGIEQYAGIAPPGTRLEVQASSTISVAASNAQALDVVWNGQDQRSFGLRGQRVEVVFTPGSVDIVSAPVFQPTLPFTATPLPTSALDADARIAEASPTIASDAALTPAAITTLPAPVNLNIEPLAVLTTPTSSVPTPLPFTGQDSPLATQVPLGSTAQPSPVTIQSPLESPTPAEQIAAQQSSRFSTPDPALLGANTAVGQAQTDPLAIPPANSTLDPTIISAQLPTETLPPTPTLAASPTPSASPTDTPSPTPTATFTLTSTPTQTVTPTNTISPTPTAILPPRVPLVSPSPTKIGA